MRPIGIHLSYWQKQWSDDVTPFIQLAKSAGFDGAEFPLLDPVTLDYPAIKDALDIQGMQATCGTGLNPNTDITSPDASTRQAGIAHLKNCLEGTASLGSPVLGGVTYTPWAYFPEDSLIARRRRCVESLRVVGKIAGDLGVTLCLEILNRFEGFLLNTVEQGLELLDEVDSSNIKLHLDTFHMNIEEDNIATAIQTAGGQIGHFHCSENNRKPPGSGHIPWSNVRQALDEVQYQGWLVMESFLLPEGEVGRTIMIWRSLTEGLDADAKTGAQFIRQEVA